MSDYFLHTPVYKIWIDVMDVLVPRASFLVPTFDFAFNQIIITQEDLKEIHSNYTKQLELIYSHVSRLFYCRLIDKTTHANTNWKRTPPELIKATDLESLKVQIDIWLNFIQTEILQDLTRM